MLVTYTIGAGCVLGVVWIVLALGGPLAEYKATPGNRAKSAPVGNYPSNPRNKTGQNSCAPIV